MDGCRPIILTATHTMFACILVVLIATSSSFTCYGVCIHAPSLTFVIILHGRLLDTQLEDLVLFVLDELGCQTLLQFAPHYAYDLYSVRQRVGFCRLPIYFRPTAALIQSRSLYMDCLGHSLSFRSQSDSGMGSVEGFVPGGVL